MEDGKTGNALLYKLWNSLSIGRYEVPTIPSCTKALVLGTGNNKTIQELIKAIGRSSNSPDLTLIASPHLKNDFSDKERSDLRILEYPETGLLAWEGNPSWWEQAFEESFDTVFFHINQENLYAVQNILEILLHSQTEAAVSFTDKNNNCYRLPTEKIQGTVDAIGQLNELTERNFQGDGIPKSTEERPRILFDCRILAEKAQTGIHRYANQLLHLMPGLIPETEVQMIGCNELSAPDGVTKIPLDLPLNNHARAGSLLGLSSFLEGSDIIFSPYYPIPEKRKAAGVLTIHDLIPLAHPEWFSNPNTIHFFKETLRASARSADKVIADSHSTKSDILRFYEIDEGKVEVVHLAPSPLFSQSPTQDGKSRIEPYCKDRSYFLSVSTLEPRKNLVRTLKAYEIFRNRNKTIDPALVLVGKHGWKCDEFHEALERSKYKESVFVTGFVDDKTLISIYQNSLAFLYPSLYEGFGLPVLEAMACGTPVITSDCSSLIEIAKDCALCCNPYEVDDIAKAMETIGTDESLRKRLINEGLRNASAYTWEKTTRETIKVLTSCLA
jgi:glycosyltransferase involved in cell wall biosynthesis